MFCLAEIVEDPPANKCSEHKKARKQIEKMLNWKVKQLERESKQLMTRKSSLEEEAVGEEQVLPE